jgi:hypothetical protein
MHSSHWLDIRFFQTVCRANPEMNLSINGRGIFESRRPVNVPICEDCPWVARDGDKTRRAMKARWFQAISQIA